MPQEIREMLQKFGFVNTEITMDIQVDQKIQIVSIKMV